MSTSSQPSLPSLPSFGALLRRWRTAAGLTQEELAERAGLSRRGINDLERGARLLPRKDTVDLLADALNLAGEDRSAFFTAARRPLSLSLPVSAPIPEAVDVPSPASPLPEGTITFLFTDIEGSTKLLQRLGDAYALALGEHQTLLRAAFAAYDGAEVDTQGDAFFVAFASAPAAVFAASVATRALASHPWPQGSTLRVRIGLHTGTAQLVGDHYVGLDVHRAARIAAAGHGGQVLLSQTTRELVLDRLPEGATLRDLGAHRLKDLQHPEQLFQLVLPDLPADFPPLKTLNTHQHNLPFEPTPLLGRKEQVAAMGALLCTDGVRLVTVTGPGGIGKTRLSIQVAAELVGGEAFSDGAWFVRLSRLVDSSLVVPTIAQTMGLKETGSQSLAELLRTHLANKRLLLVLDNFEQVVEAAGDVASLLEASPNLRVLVTSRVPLHLRGEREYPLAPLPLPKQDPRHLTPEALSQSPAVALFLERAQAAKPDFMVTAANAPAIAEICVRLDGLPLALELAAARVKVLSPEALLSRLSRRLQLLTGGARDAEERQQTMRAAIAWSEQLLLPAEQGLFRRLSVFVGGCTLEAAEGVCAAPVGAPSLGGVKLDGLTQLVDHSLVQQREEGGEARFGMLQVIREYALERLAEHGEAEVLARSQANFYRTLVEEADPEQMGSLADAWASQMDRDYDNLRAALEWAHAHGELALVADLAHGLRHYWLRRGQSAEGVHYLGWGVAASEGAWPTGTEPPGAGQQRADLDLARGQLLVFQGQPEVSMAALQRALSAFRERHDRRGEAEALAALGEAGKYIGQYEAASDYLEQSLAVAREIGDRQQEGVALSRLGQVGLMRGQPEAAADTLEQSLAIRREIRDRQGEGEDLSALGQIALLRGQLEVASDYLEQSLAITREIGDRQGEAVALGELGQVALRHGKLEVASDYLGQGLAIMREVGDRLSESVALSVLGQVALMRGHPEVAAGYLEESLAIRREIGERQGEATALNALGQIALRRQQPEAAARYLEQGLAIARAIGDRHGEGVALSRLGQVGLMRGRLKTATGALEQSLAIARAIGDRRWEARNLFTLGRVAEAQDDLEHTETLYRASLAIAAERGLGQELAEVMLALGCLLAERLDRRAEACPLLQEAAARYRDMGMPEAEEARAAASRNGCAVTTATG